MASTTVVIGDETLVVFGDEDELDSGEINPHDIDVDKITAEVIAFVVKDSTDQVIAIVSSEDRDNIMTHLVLIKESIGGTAHLYTNLISSMKSNYVGIAERNRHEFVFIKTHLEAYSKKYPGVLLSNGLKTDLIK